MISARCGQPRRVGSRAGFAVVGVWAPPTLANGHKLEDLFESGVIHDEGRALGRARRGRGRVAADHHEASRARYSPVRVASVGWAAVRRRRAASKWWRVVAMPSFASPAPTASLTQDMAAPA